MTSPWIKGKRLNPFPKEGWGGFYKTCFSPINNPW